LKKAGPDLEAFVDEGIRLSKQRGYHPHIFERMRHQHGTIRAIEKLVSSGDLQSGFTRMADIGLLDWSIEEAVVRFSDEFAKEALECATWRLQQVRSHRRA
jgi:hypothetical protein